MASEDGRADAALAAGLERQPFAFEFFQAVRLLNLWRVRADGEAVRFATPISLEFPASELRQFEPAAEPDQPGRMVVNFMGLTGPSGVLPTHYTAALIERRIRHRDVSGHRFLDLFNHRLISLFYRAWEKHHFYVAYERGAPGGVQQYLLDLVGLGTPGLRGRDAAGIDDATVCHLAGLIGRQGRSAAAVGAIVGAAFAIPAAVDSFRGHWLRLPEADRTRLGRRNANLGDEGLLGDRVWDVQSSCRLRLGPLDLARFTDLLPGASAHLALVRLLRFLLGLALKVDLQLVLRREEVPELRIGSGVRLGWTTWLTSRPLAYDPDDVVLAIGTEEVA